MAATYKVVKGDTLGKIAAQLGTTVAELLRLNPFITNKNLILIGWDLTLPGGEQEEEGGGGGAYTVVKGDTLGAIARRLGTTVAELLRLNPFIKNADLIQIGWVLTLPGGGGVDGGVEEPEPPVVEPPIIEPPAPPGPEEPPIPDIPDEPEPVPIDFERRVAELYPWLPPELIRIYAAAWAETGDQEQALARMRADDSYTDFFPGIKRDDGSLRMTEAEWFATREAYRRLFTEFGLDPALWEKRFTELMEGEVSPNELVGRLGGAYERIITNIPQVKEFYARQFGLEMTGAAIFASFLDPDIGDALLSRRISVAQVGGEGLARGFDVTDAFAGRLAAAGVDQLAARQLFTSAEGAVPTLNELARRFSDPDSDFDIEEFAEASIFGDATQRRRIRRLFASETSLFSDMFGAVATSDEFAVTGITAR